MKITTLTLLAFFSASPLYGQLFTIDDVVDVSDGWTNIGDPFFSSGSGGLSPQAGTTFFVGSRAANIDLGTWKYFTEDYVEGTYSVSFDIGRRNNISNAFVETFTFVLIADTNNNGTYDSGEELSNLAITFSDTPTPASGTWEDWTYTYEIDSLTETVANQQILGHDIGMLVVGTMDTGGKQYTFDNLSITAVPEPTSAALLLLGLAGLARRRGKKIQSS